MTVTAKYNIFLWVGLMGVYCLLFFKIDSGSIIEESYSEGTSTVNFNRQPFLDVSTVIINTTYQSNLWRQLKNDGAEDRILEQLEWIKDFSMKMKNSEFNKKRILVIKPHKFMHINYLKCPGCTMQLCDIVFATAQSLPSLKYLKQFDAVVLYDLRTNISQTVLKLIPEKVQMIVYSKENPLRVFTNLTHTNTIVATYNSHADMVFPYSKWISKYSVYKNFHTHISKHNQVNNDVIITGTAQKQNHTKMAVVFTSNCKGTNNNRFGYIKELGKYMSVDVFGKCGKKIVCGHTRMPDKRCMEQTIQQYKFYLSFENANCRNYITEKVFSNAFGNNVLPVVFGAHPDDYKRILPYHSYILVEDFESPEELAKYLILLHNNDVMYKTYFAWKGSGDFYNLGSPGYLLCRSCGMLFYADHVRPSNWSDENYMLWKSRNTCLPKNKWYWNETKLL